MQPPPLLAAQHQQPTLYKVVEHRRDTAKGRASTAPNLDTPTAIAQVDNCTARVYGGLPVLPVTLDDYLFHCRDSQDLESSTAFQGLLPELLPCKKEQDRPGFEFCRP